MVNIGVRVKSRFIAGETAPSAPEATTVDALIVNQFGDIALRGFQENGQTVILDTSTEPPTLRLNSASTTALMGSTGPDGEFVRFGNELDARSVEVSGAYTGPGSELIIT